MMLQRVVPFYSALVLTACAPALQAPPNGQPTRPGAVTIEVVNEHLSTVTVFLIRGSDRFRLGQVEPNATKRFAVSALMVAVPTARVRVQPNDLGPSYDSEPFTAESGQRIAFRVGQNVGSSLRIW